MNTEPDAPAEPWVLDITFVKNSKPRWALPENAKGQSLKLLFQNWKTTKLGRHSEIDLSAFEQLTRVKDHKAVLMLPNTSQEIRESLHIPATVPPFPLRVQVVDSMLAAKLVPVIGAGLVLTGAYYLSIPYMKQRELHKQLKSETIFTEKKLQDAWEELKHVPSDFMARNLRVENLNLLCKKRKENAASILQATLDDYESFQMMYDKMQTDIAKTYGGRTPGTDNIQRFRQQVEGFLKRMAKLVGRSVSEAQSVDFLFLKDDICVSLDLCDLKWTDEYADLPDEEQMGATFMFEQLLGKKFQNLLDATRYRIEGTVFLVRPGSRSSIDTNLCWSLEEYAAYVQVLHVLRGAFNEKVIKSILNGMKQEYASPEILNEMTMAQFWNTLTADSRVRGSEKTEIFVSRSKTLILLLGMMANETFVIEQDTNKKWTFGRE